jgi:hypothetical protein
MQSVMTLARGWCAHTVFAIVSASYMRRVDDVDASLVCAYWNNNTQTWSLDGVVLAGILVDAHNASVVHVACASVHLTAFVLGSKSGVYAL